MELDEVKTKFFAQESVDELRRDFDRSATDSDASFYFCLQYVTNVLSGCRSKNGHFQSERRRQTEEDYLARAANSMRYNTMAKKSSDSRYTISHVPSLRSI